MKNFYHLNNIKALIDANVLIDLFELNLIHILPFVFSEIVIPKITYNDELRDELKIELNKIDYILKDITTFKGNEIYHELVNNHSYKNLSRYDRFAISISGEYNYYCGSNDKLIRKACELMNINYTGTLGVIGKAFILKKISKEQFSELVELISSGNISLFVTKNILDEFVEFISKTLSGE